jgi:hypothetical protein
MGQDDRTEIDEAGRQSSADEARRPEHEASPTGDGVRGLQLPS